MGEMKFEVHWAYKLKEDDLEKVEEILRRSYPGRLRLSTLDVLQAVDNADPALHKRCHKAGALEAYR